MKKLITSIIPTVGIVLLCCTSVRAETAYDTVVPDIMSSTVSYFESSSNLPGGWYRVEYLNGAMRYGSGAAISVDDPYTPGQGFYIQHSNGASTIEAPADDTGFSTQAACESHNAGDTVFFYHSGGTIGMYLFDSPYYDNNTSGITNTPTFQLFGVPCNELPISLTAVGFDGSDFEVEANGLVGVTVSIDGSSDLISWTNLASVTIQTGGSVVADDVTGLDHQFYRVKATNCTECTGDIVGFTRLTIPGKDTNGYGGFRMIANHFDYPTDNLLNTVLSSVPNSTKVYEYPGGVATLISEFSTGTGWSPSNETLGPGEGFLISNPSTTPFTVTFMGKLKQGNLVNSIPSGYSMRSSIVPQSGGIQTALGYVPANGESFYIWNTVSQSWIGRSYEFDEWSLEPTPEVGESLLFLLPTGKNWTRTWEPCE